MNTIQYEVWPHDYKFVSCIQLIAVWQNNTTIIL